MRDKKSTVRKCKRIRDKIYDREQFASSIFKREVTSLLLPESTLVDIGCGCKASLLHSFSSCVKKAYGIDLRITETIIDGNIQIMYGDAEAIPLPDNSADVITMYDVVEHLRDPERVFLECKRVLKPGGSLLAVTPCKFYFPIFISRALPHSIRQWANRITTSTGSECTFPAYYKANSRADLRKLASSTGLSPVSIRYLCYHPEYLMFSTLIYRCGVIVERCLLRWEAFRWFRHQILCILRSPKN